MPVSTLAFGSDWFVAPPTPLDGIYAAVTRQDQEGWPEGGWRAEDRMTREEALACFTRDAAWDDRPIGIAADDAMDVVRDGGAVGAHPLKTGEPSC